MDFKAGDKVIFKQYDYEFGDEDLFEIDEILEIEFIEPASSTGNQDVIYFTDRNDGCWTWQVIKYIPDTRLNRVLYPELKPDDKGRLV
jgi:hypothetical protein